MKRKAFTLVELLTGISLAAVLTAVLMPCLHITRQRAKSLVCAGNVRELLQMITMYDCDNMRFPHGVNTGRQAAPPGGSLARGRMDSMKREFNSCGSGWWWINYITGYDRQRLLGSDFLKCPARPFLPGRYFNDILSGNYGVNQSVFKLYYDNPRPDEFRGLPLKSSRIFDPSGTMLLADAGYALVQWRHAALNAPYKPPNVKKAARLMDNAYIPGLGINNQTGLLETWPEFRYDAIEGRHPDGRINIGFADGHVSSLKADALLVEETEPNSFRLGLWKP